MSTTDTVAIIAWADNTWEYLEGHRPEDWTNMSDDTFTLYLPPDVDEVQIEEYVQAYNRGEAGPWTAS